MAVRLWFAFVVVIWQPVVARGQSRVDDHGFPLPDGASARLGDLHFAQSGPITAMALAPDGKTIASAGAGIFLWDAAKGLIVREIATSDLIISLTFSRDGRLLASASQEGRISIWDTDTGKARWQNPGGKAGWHSAVNSLKFIANDTSLAVARTDCQVQLWDVASGLVKECWILDEAKKKQIKPLDGEAPSIADVTLSPSGETMAWLACSKANRAKHCAVYLFETATGKFLQEVSEVRAPAEKLDLLDEGQNLLIKSTYLCLGPEKRNEKGEIEVTSEGGHAVVNVPDKRAGFRFDYRLTHYIGRPLGERRYAKVLGVSPDGKSLFVQDEAGIVRRELATGIVLERWRERCDAFAFFPDGKRVLLARGARLLICDLKLNSLRWSMDPNKAPYIHFLADGRLVSAPWSAARLNVWDARNRKIVESIVRVPAPFTGRTPFSFDSWEKLFAYHDEKTISVHDLVADRLLSRLDGVTVNDSPWNVWPMLSGDGKRVLVSSSDGDATLIRWFETSSGRELGRCSIPKGQIREKIRPVGWYANDGSMFGYVSADGRLILVKCGDEKRSAQIGIPSWVSAKEAERKSRLPVWKYETAGFDRFIVASRDTEKRGTSREYILFVRETGEVVRRLVFDPLKSLKRDLDPYHDWNATFSPDGRIMAVIDAPNEVKLFETASGLVRGAIRAPNAIASIDFSPDGNILATSCADTSILLWDMDAALAGKVGPPPPRSDLEADKLWQILGDPDPAVMAGAMLALRRAPELAIAMLKRQMRPVQGPNQERLQGLIDQLGSADFQTREGATRKLIEEAEYAIRPLYAALERPLPLEQLRRIENLVKRIDGAPAQPKLLHELRALELLERLGHSEARAIVATMATGHDDALVTIEAKLVLSRLDAKDGTKR